MGVSRWRAKQDRGPDSPCGSKDYSERGSQQKTMNKNKVDLQAPRILLVDDQPANLNLLYELLEGEGYRISVAPSGPVALKVVEQAEPDLILLDVMMPGMNGYEVCQKLKQDEKTQDIPVIFITAANQTEGVVAGFQAGGVDYIAKPFREEEVLVRVRTHLRLNRLQRELEAKSDALEEKNQSLEEANQALAVANQQIQQANQHKSEFLARMSHDLRTPMNAIIGYTRVLLRKTREVLDERQYRNLTNIQISADHLLSLISDILDLSKIEAGRIDIHPEDVDLQRLASDCILSIEPLLGEGVRLEQQFEAIGPVHTDPDRLRRVLMNLLSNAVKFTEEGSIAVSLRSIDGEVELGVADTGPGIPAADLPRIFDEFHQVERKGGKRKEGTGLGLAIARKSMELLGGSISVESEAGQGTRFTLRIKRLQ